MNRKKHFANLIKNTLGIYTLGGNLDIRLYDIKWKPCKKSMQMS